MRALDPARELSVMHTSLRSFRGKPYQNHFTNPRLIRAVALAGVVVPPAGALFPLTTM